MQQEGRRQARAPGTGHPCNREGGGERAPGPQGTRRTAPLTTRIITLRLLARRLPSCPPPSVVPSTLQQQEYGVQAG